jgi:small GTP-binding protein
MQADRGYKVVFIGSISVGKTTLMTRMADDRFDPNTEPTTCGAYAQYRPPGQSEVVVQFWDTAGMERYKSINKIYYRDAVAALLTFDLSDRATFTALAKWKDEFEKENTLSNAIVILVGNKCDLWDQIEVTEEDARAWAQEHGMEYFAVSAMNGEGVSELLDALMRSLPRKGRPLFSQAVPDNPKQQTDCC